MPELDRFAARRGRQQIAGLLTAMALGCVDEIKVGHRARRVGVRKVHFARWMRLSVWCESASMTPTGHRGRHLGGHVIDRLEQ